MVADISALDNTVSFTNGAVLVTRATIGAILQRAVFSQYRINPEGFMRQAARLINEQKATVIVEHLSYDPVDDRYDIDIFTR